MENMDNMTGVLPLRAFAFEPAQRVVEYSTQSGVPAHRIDLNHGPDVYVVEWLAQEADPQRRVIAAASWVDYCVKNLPATIFTYGALATAAGLTLQSPVFRFKADGLPAYGDGGESEGIVVATLERVR